MQKDNHLAGMGHRILQVLYLILWRLAPTKWSCLRHDCPKTQVGQESSKPTCCLKNVANKATKCALNAANTMEPNIVAKKRCGPKEAMRRTSMQGAFSLLVFSSSPDSLLQSQFFVSLGAPGGPPAKVVLKYQVQHKVSSFGFKRLRYVPLCIHRNQIEMQQEISYVYYCVTHHSESVYIYIHSFLMRACPKSILINASHAG